MRGIGIQVDNDFDLVISNKRGADGRLLGLEVAKTTPQNTAIIIAHHPGQFKDAPTMGVGIENVLLDNDLAVWRRLIRMSLEQDRQDVLKVVLTENKLEIDATYNSGG